MPGSRRRVEIAPFRGRHLARDRCLFPLRGCCRSLQRRTRPRESIRRSSQGRLRTFQVLSLLSQKISRLFLVPLRALIQSSFKRGKLDFECVQPPFPFVRSSLACVGDAVTLVRDPVALFGDMVAEVGDPSTLACVRLSLPNPIRPTLQHLVIELFLFRARLG